MHPVPAIRAGFRSKVTPDEMHRRRTTAACSSRPHGLGRSCEVLGSLVQGIRSVICEELCDAEIQYLPGLFWGLLRALAMTRLNAVPEKAKSLLDGKVDFRLRTIHLQRVAAHE